MQTASNSERMARKMIFTKMLKLVGVSLVSVILLLPASALAATVNLRWTANTEPDIASYNVYFGTASRSYGNPIPVGNVTSYRVNELADGQTYYFAVTALDTSGNESGFSSEESAIATSPQPNSGSLTASLSNPQVEGTIIDFTASAQGGSGSYEYRFWEYGPSTDNRWVMIRDYATNPTITWDSSGKTGTNNIHVWIRNVGTTNAFRLPVNREFIITAGTSTGTQPTSGSLTASLSNPQVEGTNIAFTASAQGGSGSYEYRFWEYGPSTNNRWVMIRDYATNPTITWDSSGKVGSNNIHVWIRNVGTTDNFRLPVNLVYNITFGSSLNGLPVIDVISSSDDGNVAANTVDNNITTRWSAQGSGEWIQYDLGAYFNISEVAIAFFYGDQRNADFEIFVSDDANAWESVLSGRSSGTTLQQESYSITGATGRFVRIVGYGNSSSSWNSITEVDIMGERYTPQPSSGSLTASLSSPQVEGAVIDFTASAQGGSGSYEYRFWEYGPSTGNQWVVIRDYATNPTITWDSSGKSGTNNIHVWIRNVGTTDNFRLPVNHVFNVN